METMRIAYASDNISDGCPYDVLDAGTSARPTRFLELWPATSKCAVVAQPGRPALSALSHGLADAGTETRVGYTAAGSAAQTNTTTGSTVATLLEEHAQAGFKDAFALLAPAVQWRLCQPAELARAIELALQLELPALARELAQLGGRLFPASDRLRRLARVLAPPVVHKVAGVTAEPPTTNEALRGREESLRGRWVATRGGRVVGTAESLASLAAVIDEDPAGTVVVRVL